MKKIIIIITTVAILAGAGAFYYYISTQKQTTPQKEEKGVVIVNPVQAEPKTNIDASVMSDFKLQISGSNKLTLDEPVVSSNYAIQTWSDENKGGQALLKYVPSQGWVLVTMGGGAWSVEDLTKVGVPKATAEQLLK